MSEDDSSRLGMRIVDGRLRDAYGNDVVPRGLCYGFAWCNYAWNPSDEKAKKEFQDDMMNISKNNANAVRLHLGAMRRTVRDKDGQESPTSVTTPEHVRVIIETCAKYQMIAILTIWDCSSYPSEFGSQPLSVATKYWTQDVKAAIVGHEDKVIINIANEPWDGANGQPGTGLGNAWSHWYEPHKKAIQEIRAAGLKHVLMVDGPTVGGDGDYLPHPITHAHSTFQDPNYPHMRNWGAHRLLHDDHDLRNIMFDIHVYRIIPGNAADVFRKYFQHYKDNKLAVMVGEFASGHFAEGNYVEFPKTAKGIITAANEKEKIGFLGWAWNSGPPNLFDHGGMTKWGKIILPALHKGKRIRKAQFRTTD